MRIGCIGCQQCGFSLRMILYRLLNMLGNPKVSLILQHFCPGNQADKLKVEVEHISWSRQPFVLSSIFNIHSCNSFLALLPARQYSISY